MDEDVILRYPLPRFLEYGVADAERVFVTWTCALGAFIAVCLSTASIACCLQEGNVLLSDGLHLTLVTVRPQKTFVKLVDEKSASFYDFFGQTHLIDSSSGAISPKWIPGTRFEISCLRPQHAIERYVANPGFDLERTLFSGVYLPLRIPVEKVGG